MAVQPDHDAPLVWIDCEMSGLDVNKDVLLEVACYITDANLELKEPVGFASVISRPASILDNMDEWNTNHHGRSGLIAKCLSPSAPSIDQVSRDLLSYIKAHVPVRKTALLAGNSVHCDKEFLWKETPEIIDWLHYRIMDVSAIKEAARRWANHLFKRAPKKQQAHEARQDILESIKEAKYWKEVLFDGK